METVYREGARIRRSDGAGYSDRVPDEEIRKHMHSNVHDREFMAFAQAVLAIRAFERAASESPSSPASSQTEGEPS